MEYDLEREVRLIHKESDGWFLQEFDKTGNQVGRKQRAWFHTQYFVASELRYYQQIEINKHNYSDDKEEFQPVKQSETIEAILYPGRFVKEQLINDTSYSMFGTDREIEDIRLVIRRTEDESGEVRCGLWGQTSHTYEIDYKKYETDDRVFVNLWLKSNNFGKIVDLVRDKKIEGVLIEIGNVDGFYSDERFEIHTKNIKILPNLPEWGGQEVTLENGRIAPFQLGEVGEFCISIYQREMLSNKNGRIITDKSLSNGSSEGGDIKNSHQEQIVTHMRPKSSSELLTQLQRNETALIRLRRPLWGIFVILLLLLVKLLV